jgi:hypothetical protein
MFGYESKHRKPRFENVRQRIRRILDLMGFEEYSGHNFAWLGGIILLISFMLLVPVASWIVGPPDVAVADAAVVPGSAGGRPGVLPPSVQAPAPGKPAIINGQAPGAANSQSPPVNAPAPVGSWPASESRGRCPSSRSGGSCFNYQPIGGLCIWSGAPEKQNLATAFELFQTPYLKKDARLGRIRFHGMDKPGPQPGTILLGFGLDQWNSYCKLGMAESNFRTNDPGSWTSDGRACGIAQSLPCDKMGPGSNNDGHTELTAWEQVVWMLVYIRDRYGNPNNAWIHEYNHSWY